VVGDIPSDSEEPMSDSMKHCEIFSPPSAVPESPTESQTSSGGFSSPGSPSTTYTEPPQEEFQEIIAKPLVEPQADRWRTIQRRSQEPPDDPHVFPHLSQDFRPPPSNPPQKKRKDFRYIKAKLREFFGLG